MPSSAESARDQFALPSGSCFCKPLPVQSLATQGLNMTHPEFLSGVIEGFYGPPWSERERMELFSWLGAWGLNTYLYAPKDDLKHRVNWRETYSASECDPLRTLVAACQHRNILFIYGIGPGLDIRYSSDADMDCMRRRLTQMEELGVRHFALLFDDIPDQLNAEDLRRWGSLAAAQARLANSLFNWVRARHAEARFFFCPTAYCGRMAERQLGGKDYLATLGRELLPEIDLFWTGPEIISREITVAHIREITAFLRRKPVIWDNLHANDYDGRRFFCGPYAGRSPELRESVRGLLSNPNCELRLNFVPLKTLADFVRCQTWDSRQAYLSAMEEWLPYFATADPVIGRDDLVLFGDCHYLPFEEGSEAEGLFQLAQRLVEKNPVDWGELFALFSERAGRLRELCARLTALKDRALFHALHRRIWDMREELDLLERFLIFTSRADNAGRPFQSDFHLPGTYRGGMVARLQGLLEMKPDGTFVPGLPRSC
jgi:protein O-GlcNAcase / histone acetyltransferase